MVQLGTFIEPLSIFNRIPPLESIISTIESITNSLDNELKNNNSLDPRRIKKDIADTGFLILLKKLRTTFKI